VSEDQLVECRDLLPTRIYGRCNYVIQENKRVIEAAEALREKNLEEFGKLLYASHEGLQNEYEVSCDELDFLVDFSRDRPYVLGSRMMGGGFGGCTLNLVHEERVDQYVSEVSAAYKNRFDIEIDAIPVSPARGTHIIQ